MATPTSAIRDDKAAACKRGSAWGTAAAVGAGDEMLITGINGFQHKRPYLPAKDLGQVMTKTAILGDVEAVDGSFPFHFRYDGGALWRLLAAVYGTAGAPTVQGATAAYKHVFQWADTTYGKFFTVLGEWPGKIYECASFKPTGFTMKVDNSVMNGEVKGIGDQLIDNSAMNGATQVDAVTNPDRQNLILAKQGSFKMSAQTGADVAGTTALGLINSIELSVARTGHDKIHGLGSATIMEPYESGFDIKLALKFARFTSDNYGHLATMIAETLQKGLLQFTGAQIAAPYNYDLKFYFPQLRIIGNPTDFSEIIKNGLELVAEEPSAAPTGMTYARPYVELINKQTSDYLV
jgi:hypothetical protein